MEHWLVLLCILLNSAAANVVPHDRTALYSYNTVMLSGSPEKTQQFAAFGLKCQLRVTKTAERQIGIQIADVTVGRANEVIHRLSPDEIPLKFSHSDIYSSNLTRPFVVQFQEDGLIEKLQFSEQETEWSKNFKSGLATMFQIKKIPLRRFIDESSSESSENQEVGSVYQDTEPNFSGVCKAIYDYQAVRADGRNGHEVNFTKAIDYDSCEGVAPYFGLSTHRAFECKECNHPQHSLHRDIIYKYNLWVDSQGTYMIRRGIADGIVRFTPLGKDADAATVLHNRTLTFVGWSSSRLSLNQEDMHWESPTSKLFERVQNMRENRDLNVPIWFRELFEGRSNSIHEARHGIKKIAQLMSSEPTTEETELILSEIVLVRRALVTLTYNQLEELAREFSSTKRERKLLFDHVVICATNPCVKFILDSSSKRVITNEETADFLPQIAAHVANPNVVLMNYMMEFCKSSNVRSNDRLMDACFLSWGSMVAKTCAKGAYQLPKMPKMFCEKGDRMRFVNVIDQMLEQIEEEERKIALIAALGNMAVREIIPVLEKYMGSRDLEERWSDVLRVKAVYALLPLAKIDPELVRRNSISIFFNAEEHRNVRIAAFDVLIASGTRQQSYEKIAARIQYEEDITVNAYVYSTFKTLANISHPCWKEVSSHAAFALKLIDERHDTSAWIACKTLVEGDMDYMDVNAFRRWSSLGDAGSLVPSRFSLQFENLLAGVNTDLYKVAFFGNNTSHLIESLLGPSALFSEKSLLERMVSLHTPKHNKGEAQIADKLGFEASREPTFWAHIARTFMDFQHRHYFITKDTIVDALKSLSNPASQMRKDLTVEKTLMPMQVYLQLPIDAGFNVELVVLTPIQVALDVTADVKTTRESSQTVFNVDLKLRAHFAAKTVTSLGVWVPPEEATFSVGLETALMANPVLSTHARLAVNETGFSFSLQPNSNVRPGESQELIHYHTKPFTAIEKTFAFRPLEQWIEIIHVMTPKETEIPLLDDILVLQMKREDFWDDRATDFKYLTENPPYGIAAFWWLTAQANMREYRIVWKSQPMPEFQYNMNWRYEAAESDPEKRYRNFWYVLWKDVAGWSDVPIDCLYDSSSSSHSGEDVNYDSSSEQRGNRHLSLDSIEKYILNEKTSSEESVEEFLGKMKVSSEETSKESFFQKILKQAEDAGILKIPRKIQKFAQKFTHGGEDIEIATIGQGVATYWTWAEAKVKSGSSVMGYSTEVVWRKHRQDLKATVRMVVQPLGNAPQMSVCLESEFVGEKPPCVFGRRIPAMRRANLTHKARISWGRSCSQPDETLDLWVTARKSEEQLNPTRDDRRPWFYRQCEKDVARNRQMSFACAEKTKDLAKLDLIEGVIRCTTCGTQNLTEHVRDFVLSQMYSHLSHDPLAQNPQKQMKLVVKFRPHIPVMDVRVERPHETLNFDQIFYGNWMPYVRRPSIWRPSTHRALNFFSDNTLTPTCTVGSNSIDNFNNQTFMFHERPACDFLLSADSTSNNLFSILTRRDSQGRKVLTVNQLKNKIEIFPHQTQDVSINGRNYTLQDRNIMFIKDEKYGPKLLGFIVKTSPLYKVVMTFNRISVYFDGDLTQIITSNLWRHKLHGVCGEFNPQERNYYRGPRKCIYSHANDFAQTYALRSKTCPDMPPKKSATCPVSGDNTKAKMMISEPGDCYKTRPLVTDNRDERITCVSTAKVKLCDDNCKPAETKEKPIMMACVSNEYYQTFNDALKEFYVKVENATTSHGRQIQKWPVYFDQQTHRVPVTCVPK